MSQIQTVKQATDIIEVIGERVSLQRSGSNWKGLCPFHSEKSPSFFVSEEMQRYKCFGCGRNGDAFTFLEEFEGMTFYEALETLAEKAGIELEKNAPSSEDKLRKDVLEALNLAKEYYHYLLVEHKAGAEGRDYLKERGISNESIKLFQLGVALPQWDGLIKYLHGKKKYSLDILLAAGLIIKSRHGRFYDRFRNRIMFPLRNHRGQIVGFSGRKVPSEDDAEGEKQAKYINSPETLVYHKSQLLYGFSELLQPIRKQKQVIIVEGELDVIGSVQAHVNHVVAVKGSAVTEQQIKLLSRSVDQIILCLDADSAGVEATKKAIAVVNNTEMSRQTPLELRVTRIPSGKDPADLSKDNPKLWRETAKKSMTAYEFLMDVAFEQHDISTPSGKAKIMQELVPVLADVQHAVEKEHYTRELAKRLQVSMKSVEQDIAQYGRGKKVGSDRTSTSDKKKKEQQPKESSRRSKLEQYAWFVLLHSKPENLVRRAEQLAELPLELAGAQKILDTLIAANWDGKKEQSMQDFVRQLPDDLQQTVFGLYSQQQLLNGVEGLDFPAEWKRTLTELKQESVKGRIAEISAELEKLDSAGELSDQAAKKQSDLLQELVRLRGR